MDDKKNGAPTTELFGQVNKTVRQGVFPPHRHAMAELYVCLRGTALDTMGKVTRAVGAGDVFVLPTNGIHRQSDLQGFSTCVFQFSAPLLLRAATERGIAALPAFSALFSPTAELGDIQTIDSETVAYIEATADLMCNEDSPTVLNALFLSVVALLSAKCRPRGEGGGNPPKSAAAIAAYMEEHYREPLTLPHLASLSHYSVRHLTRLFREGYGVSPMQYLDRLRLSHATRLLLGSKHSIGEITLLCGYPDVNLFSRHFRIAFHTSPSKYRKANRPEAHPLAEVNILHEE